MAGRRRRRRRMSFTPFLVALGGVAVVGWLFRWGGEDPIETGPVVSLTQRPALTTDRPVEEEPTPLPPDVSEKGSNDDHSTGEQESKIDNSARCAQLIAAGKQALSANDLLAARSHFSEALALDPGQSERVYLRAELTRIGDETIFSPRIFQDDPCAEGYVIKTGDNLARIAKEHEVSPELLASINGIPNPNLIRAGQRIKILKGPFRAVVDKKSFSLDVYLGDVYVKQFRVGLGADDSTPTGKWRVATKLVNPTYYPPRGGKIISADDPANPLGERWIGLEGVGGDAQGMQRYGIHGTVDPDSIGKLASMGCIRLFNEDVELLYTYLVEKHSEVIIR